VLSQTDDNGNERVVQYLSRTTTQAESKYSIWKLEAACVSWAVENCRPYLLQKEFTIVTDNDAVRWLLSSQSNAHLARLAIKLQEYAPFKVQHRPGVANKNADALSRMPQVFDYSPTDTDCTAVPTFVASEQDSDNEQKEAEHKHDDRPDERILPNRSQLPQQPLSPGLEELKSEQRKDRFLSQIIKAFEEQIVPEQKEAKDALEEKRYVMDENGVLCRQLHEMQHREGLPNTAVVVPQRLQQAFISMFHASVLGGHCGAYKTFGKMIRRFWWKAMRKDVKKYVKQCWQCSAAKGSKPVLHGKMQTIAMKAPFDTIYVDIKGPMPVSINGNKHIVTIYDGFTHWPEAAPVRDATVETVANVVFQSVICRHGVPRIIITDRGPQFDNALFRKLNEWAHHIE